MPQPIAAILDSKLTAFAGRLLLTFVYWSSGFMKLIDWNGGVADMTRVHLSPPGLYNAATVIVQLGGSALILWGPYAWLGAGALGIFTLLTIPLAHAYWTMSGPERMSQMYTAIEHVGLIGALILVAVMRHRELGARGQASSAGPTTASAAAS